MKITKARLAEIIKEESKKVLTEGYGDYSEMVDKLKKNLKKNNVDMFEPPTVQEGNYDDYSDQLVREILTVVGGLLEKFGEKDMHPEVLDGLIQIQNITNR